MKMQSIARLFGRLLARGKGNRSSDRAVDNVCKNGSYDLDGDELAAVIAAAVMAGISEPKCRLRAVSVKRLGHASPVWNSAGRLERISGKL